MSTSGFPPKKQASDWLTELVDQSGALFLAGKALNICPSCPFQKTVTLGIPIISMYVLGTDNFQKIVSSYTKYQQCNEG